MRHQSSCVFLDLGETAHGLHTHLLMAKFAIT